MVEICTCDNEYLKWSDALNQYVCDGCGLPPDEQPILQMHYCPDCNGRGDWDGWPCEHCDGMGYEWWED